MVFNCHHSGWTSPFGLLQNATSSDSPKPTSLSNHQLIIALLELLVEGTTQFGVRVRLDPGDLSTLPSLLYKCESSCIVQRFLSRIEDLRGEAVHMCHGFSKNPLLWSEPSDHGRLVDGMRHVNRRLLQGTQVVSAKIILV